MTKVSVPRNVEELLTLANSIYSRHSSDGNTSPLLQLEDYNFSLIGPNLQQAFDKHKEAENFTRQAEKAYEQRNNLMGDIQGVVKASRDLLKAKFAKTPKRLGDWGFDVTEKAASKAPVPVNAGAIG